jgi:hypothetical protein
MRQAIASEVITLTNFLNSINGTLLLSIIVLSFSPWLIIKFIRDVNCWGKTQVMYCGLGSPILLAGSAAFALALITLCSPRSPGCLSCPSCPSCPSCLRDARSSQGRSLFRPPGLRFFTQSCSHLRFSKGYCLSSVTPSSLPLGGFNLGEDYKHEKIEGPAGTPKLQRGKKIAFWLLTAQPVLKIYSGVQLRPKLGASISRLHFVYTLGLGGGSGPRRLRLFCDLVSLSTSC